MKKAHRPKIKMGDGKTFTGMPMLGHLVSLYCPKCGMHLFSFYEGDLIERPGYKFSISNDCNYCIKCGALLDLDEWKNTAAKSIDDEIKLED